jgi:hypothetical protein
VTVFTKLGIHIIHIEVTPPILLFDLPSSIMPVRQPYTLLQWEEYYTKSMVMKVCVLTDLGKILNFY